ncbi:MAG: hypothetical protein C0474_00115 [Sphingobium sp.]|nr:hypothetical protein [Sphingobium sp.]
MSGWARSFDPARGDRQARQGGVALCRAAGPLPADSHCTPQTRFDRSRFVARGVAAAGPNAILSFAASKAGIRAKDEPNLAMAINSRPRRALAGAAARRPGR